MRTHKGLANGDEVWMIADLFWEAGEGVSELGKMEEVADVLDLMGFFFLGFSDTLVAQIGDDE